MAGHLPETRRLFPIDQDDWWHTVSQGVSVNRPVTEGGKMDEEGWRKAGGLSLDVMDPAPVGVAVTSGREHRLVYSNLAIQEILGERPLGVPAREAFGDVAQRGYYSLLDQVLQTGEPMTLHELPFEYRGRTGHERW